MPLAIVPLGQIKVAVLVVIRLIRCIKPELAVLRVVIFKRNVYLMTPVAAPLLLVLNRVSDVA